MAMLSSVLLRIQPSLKGSRGREGLHLFGPGCQPMQKTVTQGSPYSRALVWLVTYRCPLLCTHCHSESGRRPSRQLPPEKMQQLVDVLLSMRLRQVTFSGGEPLTVPGLTGIAERLSKAGVQTILYTSGWGMTEALARRLGEVFHEVHVSLDGATADVHDRIRGRPGSFVRTLAALELLNQHASSGMRLDIECVVVRSNHDQLERFCTEVAPRFPRLRHLVLGAVAPSGLATRETFASQEFLTDDEMHALDDPAVTARLQALAPPGVAVQTTSNFSLKTGRGCWYIQPDGDVQAMPSYEGAVGNLLSEPPELLWSRCQERRGDPFVRSMLDGARTVQEWVEAVRRIDLRFGSEEDQARIGARAAHPAPARASR
ncbi:radical SAM protein [Corallococcus sp. AB018]|uniref:radical SAM protein n=1 Tax=Corallococcus TaxID=83461 RepID=UPI000F89462D|nr:MULTISPECIES: radical SAM protein [Corallococcus]RUO89450.1 radical SAM protein [Corallococcus sp. AB018]